MTRLTLGLLFPLSGMWGWVGELCVRGVEAALEVARERDAKLPEHIELLCADVADVADARREAERLADQGATVLIGTVFSAPALRASEVANERGLFYLETVAAASELTARGHANLIRFNTTARAYGRAAAEVVGRVLPARRAAIVQQDDPFCASFAMGARDGDLEIVAHEVFPLVPGEARAAVARAARSRPDVAILAGFSGALPELWVAARSSLPETRALVGNGAWAVRPIVDGAPLELDGLLVVDTPHPGGLAPGAVSARGMAQREEWDARHEPPRGVDVPVDPDMAFIASSLFFEEVVPRAAGLGAAELRAAAAAVDVPLGETMVGYGARFDRGGDNERSFPVVLQWEAGSTRVVHPMAVALAAPHLMR